jgi:uncharacterized protein
MSGSDPSPTAMRRCPSRRSGREDIKRYLDGLCAYWDMVSHDMDEFVAEGDRVIVIGRVAWRHKGSGQVADTPKVDVWRFKDGKAVEYFELYDTAKVYACAHCG